MTDLLPPMRALAIVAGGGVFPDLVAQAAIARGIDVFGVCLDGHAEDNVLASYPRMVAAPEHMGRVFKELRVRGIGDLVLIGRMKRPRVLSLRPDLTTLRLLPRILMALVFKGDDGLLRAVRSALESEGFKLHGAHAFLGEHIATAGPMGQVVPDADALRDIQAGIKAARTHGLKDLGQAVVMLRGRVLGLEDRAGTDALIRRAGQAGAILVKMAKPQQDRGLDLPSIGLETLKNCVSAGYAGVAVEAGATLMADKKEMIDFANTHRVFLVGVS